MLNVKYQKLNKWAVQELDKGLWFGYSSGGFLSSHPQSPRQALNVFNIDHDKKESEGC